MKNQRKEESGKSATNLKTLAMKKQDLSLSIEKQSINLKTNKNMKSKTPTTDELFEIVSDGAAPMNKKSHETDPCVLFYTDEAEILGVFDDYVYLTGYARNVNDYRDPDDLSNDCIVKISKMSYLKSWELCLNETQRLCKRSKKFHSSVGGVVSFDFKKLEANSLNDMKVYVYQVEDVEYIREMDGAGVGHEKYIWELFEARQSLPIR